MRKPLFACVALTLFWLAPVASAAPAKAARTRTPTPTPGFVSAGKETNAAAKYLDLYVLPLKIDAVTLVSSWTPCAPLPGYAQVPGSGNLLGKDGNTVGFCGIASVRLKKTDAKANLAGRKITIQVSEEHNNITPWQTIVGLYTLPFPASGDTLTYPRVAVGSFPGDNPAGIRAEASNRQRKMDADHMFSPGRPVLVELRNNGQTVGKKSCTFKTTQSPSGPGPATLTCN
jgi:hypothetical protein